MMSLRKSLRHSGLTGFAIALLCVHSALPLLAQNQAQIPTAEFFNSLSPQQIAGYFTQLSPEQMQGFFTQMDQGALTNVLGKLGDEGVKAVVGQLPPEVVQGFIDNMSNETYMGFVAGVKDPELLGSLGFDDADARDAFLLDNLENVDPALANVLYSQIGLATDNDDLEAALSETYGADNFAGLLLSLDEEGRAELLSTLDADELNELSDEVADLSTFLDGVDPDAVAEALDELSPEDAEAYLAAIDPEALNDVLGSMDSLEQLQGLLEAYPDDLDAAEFEDAIASLEDAQATFAEELDVAYDEIDAAAAEFNEAMEELDESMDELDEVLPGGDDSSDEDTGTDDSSEDDTSTDESGEDDSGSDSGSEAGSEDTSGEGE